MSKFIKNIVHSSHYQNKIIQVCCNFELANFDEQLYQQFNIKYPVNISKAVAKRKAEFLAGRYVAQQALKELGIPIFDIPIGENRQPIWATNIVGSISHSNSVAICIVSFREHCEYLGIDYENWMSRELAKDLAKQIINDSEYSFLTKQPLAFHKALTTTFSAKESLFKALYPLVGDYFGFDAARMVSFDLTNNLFTLQLAQDLSKELKKGMIFTGEMFFDSEGVMSRIVEQPLYTHL